MADGSVKNIFTSDNSFYDHLANVCASSEIFDRVVKQIGEMLDSGRSNQFYGGQKYSGVEYRLKGEERKRLGMALRVFLKNDDGSDYTPMLFLGYTHEAKPKIGFIYQADQIDWWQDYTPRA